MLTISTSVSRREAEDLSGPRLAEAAERAGCEVVAMEVVPDDFALIEDRLHHYVDDGCDLIFTTGGTGLTPDDVTPEATRSVIERDAPGFAEAMRAEGAKYTPMVAGDINGDGYANDRAFIYSPAAMQGIGSVLLHLAWSRPDATLVGLEAQAVSFALLRRNVDENRLAARPDDEIAGMGVGADQRFLLEVAGVLLELLLGDRVGVLVLVGEAPGADLLCVGPHAL